MAGEQRRLAHSAKRDSTSMKTLSLLGAIFLPATYLASVFSMTFFNFQNGTGEPPDPDGPVVSPELWIYFAISGPLTAAVVLVWKMWDRRREQQYAQEDLELNAEVDRLEAKIMATMRERTLSKARTWDNVGNLKLQ